MYSGRGIAVVLAIVAGVLGTAYSAAAEESGSFSVIRNFVKDYISFEHAQGTITGGSLEGTGTVLQSSGEPFVEREHSLVTCMVYAKGSTDGISLEAPCTTTDASGDMWYALSKRSEGDVATGGGGGWELMGGTGKYADVTGRCSYATSYLAENRSVTMADCSWHRP